MPTQWKTIHPSIRSLGDDDHYKFAHMHTCGTPYYPIPYFIFLATLETMEEKLRRTDEKEENCEINLVNMVSIVE